MRAVTIFVVVGTLGLPTIFTIASWISPPYTSDGHPVMPIGHAMLAMLLSPLIALVPAYMFALRSPATRDSRRSRSTPRAR